MMDKILASLKPVAKFLLTSLGPGSLHVSKSFGVFAQRRECCMKMILTCASGFFALMELKISTLLLPYCLEGRKHKAYPGKCLAMYQGSNVGQKPKMKDTDATAFCKLIAAGVNPKTMWSIASVARVLSDVIHFAIITARPHPLQYI